MNLNVIWEPRNELKPLYAWYVEFTQDMVANNIKRPIVEKNRQSSSSATNDVPNSCQGRFRLFHSKHHKNPQIVTHNRECVIIKVRPPRSPPPPSSHRLIV